MRQVGAALLKRLEASDLRSLGGQEHMRHAARLAALASQATVAHAMAQAVSEKLKWPGSLKSGRRHGFRSSFGGRSCTGVANS